MYDPMMKPYIDEANINPFVVWEDSDSVMLDSFNEYCHAGLFGEKEVVVRVWHNKMPGWEYGHVIATQEGNITRLRLIRKAWKGKTTPISYNLIGHAFEANGMNARDIVATEEQGRFQIGNKFVKVTTHPIYDRDLTELEDTETV